MRIGNFRNNSSKEFNPPGKQQFANDWVLVLDDVAKDFVEPGRNN